MSKKRCFFLKGFDIQEVNKKYGLCIISNIEVESSIPTNKTSLSTAPFKTVNTPRVFLLPKQPTRYKDRPCSNHKQKLKDTAAQE